jgi:hypothetical protein
MDLMANTLLIKSPGTITDATAPKYTKDPIINAGSICLIDALRIGCFDPSIQSCADGVHLKNLVDGAPDAILKIPNLGDLTFVSGHGFQTKPSSVSHGRIQIGGATDYFNTNLTDDFLMIGWATGPGSDVGGSIGVILWKSLSVASFAGTGPFLASRASGGGGQPDLVGKWDGSGSNGYTVGGGVVPTPVGNKVQYGVAKVGTNIKLFRNGQQVGSDTAMLTPALAANAAPLDFLNASVNSYGLPGLIGHRVYIEDLSISGAASGLSSANQAASVILADYNNNVGRF